MSSLYRDPGSRLALFVFAALAVHSAVFAEQEYNRIVEPGIILVGAVVLLNSVFESLRGDESLLGGISIIVAGLTYFAMIATAIAFYMEAI